MADIQSTENTQNDSVSTGKDILDATQNAVINAVENVSEIIEQKEEKVESIVAKTTEELQPKEPFYVETEFWVAMAFFIFVVAIILLAGKIICKILRQKIANISSRISEAIKLRDDAQLLLADYERKFISADKEVRVMIEEETAKIEKIKQKNINAFEEEMMRKTKEAQNKFNVETNNLKDEISKYISTLAIEKTKNFCSENISDKRRDKLIDISIAKLKNMK